MTKHIGLFILLAGCAAGAQTSTNLKKDFETLGDNKEVIERIQKMDSHQKVRVVQNRLVDRNGRLELGVDYIYDGGGDNYVNTTHLGGMLSYHFNPRWSVGLEYQKAYNKLTPEGQSRFDRAAQAQAKDPGAPDSFPSVDFALQTTMATVSFYPVYGKLNLFDSGIAQFDLYALVGYGKMELSSGLSDTYAGGLGAGIWISPRFTTRFEVRYQQYTDLLDTERRSQNTVQALASVGVFIW